MSVKQTERYVAFVFGVVFVVVMLALAVWVPEPKPFQYTVFRVVLALAGAGVAAMIPGFLQVEVSTVIRAGGALAVFVILYFYNPAALVSTPPDKVNEPKISYELGQDLQTTLYVLNQVTEGEPNAVADAKAAARERLKLIQSKADQLDLHLDLTSVVDFSALPGNVFPEREYDTVVQAITNAHGARASAAFETGWLLSWLFVQGSTVFDEAHVRTYPEHSQQFVAVYPPTAGRLNGHLAALRVTPRLPKQFPGIQAMLADCKTIREAVDSAVSNVGEQAGLRVSTAVLWRAGPPARHGLAS